jgi:O-methyltransferase domain
MTGISRGANRAIAQKFAWSNYRTFADVGTAQGDLAVQIAVANSHLSGFGFDLPEVGPIFEEYVEQHGLNGRLRFHPGNFFTDSLPKVDVITIGDILHDWDLDEKKMLLRKAHDALSDGGAVIIYDTIIDDDRSQNAFGLMMSLNMLVETPGGFDYTGRDCIAWMKEVGFREAHGEHLAGPDSMVVGTKWRAPRPQRFGIAGASHHLYSKIIVLFRYNRIRFSMCHRTARDNTTFSTSLPFSTRFSSESRCEIRTTPCSIIGPSSSTSVT